MAIVIKASGEKEDFSEEKILQSIQYAGVPETLQQKLLDYIKENTDGDTTTEKIYRLINGFLEKSPYPYLRARYSLKQAIMDFGPTGFPFEDFVAKILEEKGYTTKVRVILQGFCVSHEIDVLAEKGEEKIMVEVKFHNYAGTKTDIHVALYTKARFDDLKEKHKLTKSWLVTNTKTTLDATAYGHCVGMNIIDWRHPNNLGLASLVEETKLHPLTSLTTLSQSQKKILLDNHIVLCKDICNDLNVLDILSLSNKDKETVFNEAQFVCSGL